MPRKIVRDLIYAQISFFSCLFVDILITTKGFTDNRGLSFYGEHLNTIVPFAVGFLLCDFFLLRVARYLPTINPKFSAFTLPLRILVVLLIFIVLTPDSLNGLFNALHNTDSFSLFSFELALSIWLVSRWHSSPLSWFLVSAQFVAGVCAGLSEFNFIPYLSESSLFYQLFFGGLLLLTITTIVRNNQPQVIEEQTDG